MEEWSQACGPLEAYGGAGLVDGGDPRPGAPHDGTVAEGPREGTTEGGGERAYLGLDPVGDPDPDGGHAYAHGRPCTPTRTTECCGDGPCRRGVVPPYSARPHDCAGPMAVLHVNENGARKNDSTALAQACAMARSRTPTAPGSARRAPWPGARHPRAQTLSPTPPRTANAPTGSTTTVRPHARLARQIK